MENYGEVFVGIDKAKKKHAVAIADAGRDGETRYLGKVNSAPAMAERVIKKLASKCAKVRVCHEAGATGYGLALDHECTVVAPLMLPKKPGDRIKTKRRDAVSAARLFRAGELTSVRVPDGIHEAVHLLDAYRFYQTNRGFDRMLNRSKWSVLLDHHFFS